METVGRPSLHLLCTIHLCANKLFHSSVSLFPPVLGSSTVFPTIPSSPPLNLLLLFLFPPNPPPFPLPFLNSHYPSSSSSLLPLLISTYPSSSPILLFLLLYPDPLILPFLLPLPPYPHPPFISPLPLPRVSLPPWKTTSNVEPGRRWLEDARLAERWRNEDLQR